jgi:hypothetical protein
MMHLQRVRFAAESHRSLDVNTPLRETPPPRQPIKQAADGAHAVQTVNGSAPSTALIPFHG